MSINAGAMESILRTHRDAALKLLSENQERVREGVDMLVQGRLPDLLAQIQAPGGPHLTDQQVESLYQEVLALAYNMFALGYSVARMGEQETTQKSQK